MIESKDMIRIVEIDGMKKIKSMKLSDVVAMIEINETKKLKTPSKISMIINHSN